MDDSCAVCAETLEWLAYGACGHKEVCSTCVIRLRFVCEDRQCCICKSESNIIFITKALGDYTRMINNFSVLPHNPTEGRVGPYWYHEGTEAYFDDLDHYKMIEAMCKLSCSVCDKIAEQTNQGSKRRGQFKNIEQLKSHLFQRHKLLMCSLCLESRKVFICEQKLYTRSQLDQHIRTGDSEVDGNECERGGFAGHPMCDFCRNPFYGDNELYLHMSTEHYTCHICLRQHPGQYEYYKNYDDLEIHFRQQHFLCEDEDCLAKKFIVFTTTSEMKRHNALEHGGNMSRAKRSAALQIPTSFLYRRSNEQDRHRNGNFRRNSSDYQLSLAIEASHEMPNVERFHATSSPVQRETIDIDSIVNPFELLATTESEASSRYCQATGQNSMNLPLTESSFPPLPITSRRKQKSRNSSDVSGGNTMASRIRRRNNGGVTVLNVGKDWPAGSHQPSSSASSSSMSRCAVNCGLVLSSSSGSSIPSESKPPTVNGFVPASNGGSSQLRPGKARGHESANSSSSSKNLTTSGLVDRASLVLNVAERGALDPSISNFPPVSATQNNKLPTSNHCPLKVENVQTDNKSLVEKIRAALDFDKDKYSAFKEISSEYRRGLIDTGEYLGYVYQFDLTHLVLELARLCPDAQKQKELVETYNLNMRSGSYRNSLGNDSGQLKNKKGSRKGKEKCEENGVDRSKDSLSVDIVSSQKKLHSMLSKEEVEVLSKDGYRSAKGKSKILLDSEQTNLSYANQSQREPDSQTDSQTPSGSSKKKQQTGGGGNQQRKKIPKFLRARLGDNSVAALTDNDNPGPDQTEEKYDPSEGLPVHGVWRNRGGQKLVAMTQRHPPK